MATEQEFFDFFNSLAPAEQRKFLGSFGDTQENLYDDSAFQEDPYTYSDPMLTQTAGAPQMDLTSMLLGQMAGGAYPQYTSAGKLDPLDLSQLAQRLNFTQDIGGSMFDNATALFAGPDAWGSPEQFQPVVSYTGKATPASYDDQGNPTPQTKSSRMFEIAKQSGGARGFLADLIDQGVDPEAAVAALRDVVTNGPNAQDPKLRQQAQEIRRTLDVWRTTDPATLQPKQVDRNTAPWEDFDEDSLRKTAQDMFEQKLGDEFDASTLVYNPDDGNFYQGREEKPSPSMQKFQNAGLPLPTEQYTDPERMASLLQSIDPGYAERQMGRDQQVQTDADAQEARRQDLLAKQLAVQDYDRRLNAISSEVRPDVAARTMINRRIQMGNQSVAQPQGPQLPPGFSATTNPNAPGLQGVRGGQPSGALGPFSSVTNPNAPTVQGVNAQGQPHVAQSKVVYNSSGQPRVVNDDVFDFGLTSMIFPGANPTGQNVRTDQRLKGRNVQAERKANLAQQQRNADQYNREYYNRHNRPASQSEWDAAYAAGQARGRAMDSTPLQDVMLARLLSLKSRAGI